MMAMVMVQPNGWRRRELSPRSFVFDHVSVASANIPVDLRLRPQLVQPDIGHSRAGRCTAAMNSQNELEIMVLQFCEMAGS